MSRADMESASPHRHTLQAAAEEPWEEPGWPMMVYQTRRKVRWGKGEPHR